MNFWTNKEYNQIKVLLVIAIVAVGGIFAYKYAGDPESISQGSILQGTKKNAPEQIMYVNITHNNDGSCVMNTCADNISGKGTRACVSYTGTTETSKAGQVCNIPDATLMQYGGTTKTLNR